MTTIDGGRTDRTTSDQLRDGDDREQARTDRQLGGGGGTRRYRCPMTISVAFSFQLSSWTGSTDHSLTADNSHSSLQVVHHPHVARWSTVAQADFGRSLMACQSLLAGDVASEVSHRSDAISVEITSDDDAAAAT
jgi:hypothetical protein